MKRKDALKRLLGLAPNVEAHLAKIQIDPENQDVPHWVKEIESWLQQIENALPQLGRRTAREWGLRLREWRRQLEGQR